MEYVAFVIGCVVFYVVAVLVMRIIGGPHYSDNISEAGCGKRPKTPPPDGPGAL